MASSISDPRAIRLLRGRVPAGNGQPLMHGKGVNWLAIFALIPLEKTLLMIMLCWVLTIIGAVLGGGVLFATFIAGKGAPEEAAAAAFAVALVVVPYCFARACSEFSALSRRQYAEWRRRTMDSDFTPIPGAPTR